MKKIILSAVAVLSMGTLSASANDVKFYVNSEGQVFTTKAEGRIELKKPHTPVFAKSSKLKFSGVHYLGLTQKSIKGKDSTTNFELRRNYFQVKAYLLNNSKSYVRITLDTAYDAKHDNYADMYAKYAYLYLNNVLPSTSVEIGMVHRPWLDYETHSGWLNRSISDAAVAGTAHIMNSADLGVNFKTNTPYFTSEVGIFNGEGYHGKNSYTDDDKIKNHIGDGLSVEWRLTGAMMGNGKSKRKATKDTYFDASFFGQYNVKNAKNNGKTFKIYGLHTVYNMPSFLVSAQYMVSDTNQKDSTSYNGQGYSANTEYRLGNKKEYAVIARYDNWEEENSKTGKVETTKKRAIGAIAWTQNKNVRWLLSGEKYNIEDYTTAMITADVHW